jgi:hypothetical protein
MNIKKLLSGGHSDTVAEMRCSGTSSVNGSTAEETLLSQQNRIANQDKAITEMRCELGKMQLTIQSLEADKEELRNQIESKDQHINELKRQLGGKDKVILQQKSQFEDAVKNLSLANKAKACLTARLVDQDKKLAVLEQVRNPKPLMREELQVARDALHSLRTSFKGNNPHHHTLDTLEQSIALLMERLHMAEAQKFSKESCCMKQLNFDSTGDPKRSPITAYATPLQRFDITESGTKVVYFTERAVTPFMSSIPKRMGDIRLKDFKSMFDRPGNFRFHFKSVDPEYGIVKEEIINDETILPGWDGKIVAWVQEDNE